MVLSVLAEYHVDLPLHQRPMKKLIDPPADIPNPVYEIEGFMTGRKIEDPPKHYDACCSNRECPEADAEGDLISGFRYYCADCVPDQVDFCSTCVAIPGQTIDHDPTHRLIRLLPTDCAMCQSLGPLKMHSADAFRGQYKEYSALGSTLKRVAEARACVVCTFVWNALLQHPLDDIEWPPSENQEVKIRIRMPFSDWLEIAVVSDAGVEESKVEFRGQMYTIRKQNSDATERALQVGLPLKWSHQIAINPLLSTEDHFGSSHLARVQKSSGSTGALILAKMWLNNCRETHASCNDLGSGLMPPTRVIDLLGKDSSRVYLRETKGETCEYAALSYCWGPNAPGLFTSKSNFTTHCEDGIDIEKLPKTIQEAIFAARKLDLRFLWVDRLCIIQDSRDDWTHQAALMCAVYSGATLTLSADGSDCATKGLFHTEQALSKLDYQKYRSPDGDDTTMVLIDPQDHRPLGTRFLTSDQPIDSRGWTMQERLMSPRVLHFTTDEMVWECDTLTECECRRQSGVSTRHLSVIKSVQSMEIAYVQWHVIAQAYAKRAFQCESDKIPALRGLVEKFRLLLRDISGANSKPPDEHLAGLWKGDLVAQLAWKPPSEADLKAYKNATDRRTFETQNMGDPCNVEVLESWLAIIKERAKYEDWHESGGYIAPSWSWAHLRGPISYHFCFPSSPFVSYAEVIEARVVPVNPDEPTGPVSSGFITLNGHMVREMNYRSSYGIYDDGKVEDFCCLSKEKDGHHWYIWFKPDDSAGLTRRRGSELSNVILFLLGTQDLNASEAGPGISIGAAPPMKMIREKLETEADAHENGIKGVDPFLKLLRQDQALISQDQHVLETGVDSLDIAGSPPEELLEVFREHGQDGIKTYRWSSFLVLVESEQQRGKYERIGCFDVCSLDVDKIDILGTLFHHSKKERITII